MKNIFISYRRHDSSPIARGLRASLIEAFGEVVFMDIDEIRIGDTWPQTIADALSNAAVLLVVIGPTWLRMSDIYGRRSLDQPNDWVRMEIENSFQRSISIIPILVGKATMPPKEALPSTVDDLVTKKFHELRETHWKHDLLPLVDRLAAPPFRFQRRGDRVPVPKWQEGFLPDQLPRALRGEEIQRRLKAMKDWKVIISPLPGQYPLNRAELSRQYKFGSFREAVDFMQLASFHINSVNHHPRWENVFKTITVWLSTWDVGHAISHLDFDLTNYLDNLYLKYV